MHGEIWYQALIYLAAAVISVPIAKRSGLGSVLGYLLAGVVIGPFGLALLGQDQDEIMHFAEFGVVMMLFLIGLELQPTLLWRMRGPILGLGGLQVGVTMACIACIALACGLSASESLAVGMILALSSTAIVLQTLAEKGLMKTPAGQSSFAVLLFQDIAVIPMLALLPLLASHADESAAAHAEHSSLTGWQQTLVVLGVIGGVVCAGRYLSLPVFRFIANARMREVFTAAALLLVVGISLAMTAIGLSPALGAFVAGVVLANNEYRHELEADIEPFKGLLLGLFFISVGASIDFALLGERPWTILGLVALLVVVKLGVLALLGRGAKIGVRNNLIFTFGLAQGGEFAFVLFSFADQNGVLTTDTTAILIAVVALSMVLTPVLMIVEERVIRPRLAAATDTAKSADREPIESHDNPVIIAGFGRFGHIVGRLLNVNGIGTTVLDLDPHQIEVLRKFGFKLFYGDASRVDLLESAGARSAKLLVIATGDPDKTFEIAERAIHTFPNLTILARARGRREAYALQRLGIEHVFRESFGSSIDAGIGALRALGFRAHDAHRAAALFRRHDEHSVRELGAQVDDHAAYVSAARQSMELLESVLAADTKRAGKDGDAGWDPPDNATRGG